MKKYTLAVMLVAASLGASAQWQYETKKSAMSDAPEKRATIKSENKFSFGFPYQGGTSEWLYVRSDADGLDFAIGINRGQIVTGEGVAIRFDSQEIVEFPLSDPADGNSRLAFIHFPGYLKGCTSACEVSQADFLRHLLESKRARLQATYYQEGQKVYEFKTAGLVWSE